MSGFGPWIAKTFEELSAREVYEILRARAIVFVKEQGINCVDPDTVDYSAIHIFAMKDEGIYAYLRAYRVDDETVKVGRILAVPHRQGIGTELMKFAIKEIIHRTGCKRIVMDAQKYAVKFYENLGFVVTSDDYYEEGVLHVDMCLDTGKADIPVGENKE